MIVAIALKTTIKVSELYISGVDVVPIGLTMTTGTVYSLHAR